MAQLCVGGNKQGAVVGLVGLAGVQPVGEFVLQVGLPTGPMRSRRIGQECVVGNRLALAVTRGAGRLQCWQLQIEIRFTLKKYQEPGNPHCQYHEHI